jgi:hypothetical protein
MLKDLHHRIRHVTRILTIGACCSGLISPFRHKAGTREVNLVPMDIYCAYIIHLDDALW